MTRPTLRASRVILRGADGVSQGYVERSSMTDSDTTSGPESSAGTDTNTDTDTDDQSEGRSRFEKMPIADLERELGVTGDGITSAEAAQRLTKYGPNALPEDKQNIILEFLSHFWDPISWMIEVAAVITAVEGQWAPFFVIIAMLLLNGVIGFWQEHNAGNAIAALKDRLAGKAKVKRDGAWSEIAAADVVPGELVRVRLGDVMPADARIISDDELDLDQSALTGESLPVKKGKGGTAYSGSIVNKGESDCLVYATGTNTFFGQTAELVEKAGNESNFQKAVLKIGEYLSGMGLAVVIVVYVVAVLRDLDAGIGSALLYNLTFAVVVLIAAIPIALPAVLAVTMAVGAQKLAKKEAIVTHLPAIEEVGGADILCSDKTGTLTQNKLTIDDPYLIESSVDESDDTSAEDNIVIAACLASRAEDKDPIDLAVLADISDASVLDTFTVSDFVPFDPVNKRTEATVTTADGSTFKVTKGAPQVIQAMAHLDPTLDATVTGVVDDFATRGFRALGVARTMPGHDDWKLLGILPLSDPPRVDSKETIAEARRLGVDVKMVTGDNLAIAKEVASEIGLGTNMFNASTLTDPTKTDAEIAAQIVSADGYAEVFPEHKYRIVKLLQESGHVTAMTGDGVNDAPALKQADAGIAVSGATDAARAAADIVLVAPGLSVIIDAIAASREIFGRMTSYTLYRIAETIALLFFITIVSLVYDRQAVTAIMVLILAILNDGSIMTIAYDNAPTQGKPQAWNMRRVLNVSTWIGVFNLIETLAFFLVILHFVDDFDINTNLAKMQTLLYLQLSVSGHLTIFVTRVPGALWSLRPATALWVSVVLAQTIASMIAGFGVGFLGIAPIPWMWVGITWAYVVICVLFQDAVKLAVVRAFYGREEDDETDDATPSAAVAA